MFDKTKAFIKSHKIISAIIIIVLLAGGYFLYGALAKGPAKTTYVTSAVTKGTITTSVSGSGQVSASNSISLQFKASGTLTYLGVQDGQYVSSGQLIAQLDTTDAQKTVRDAQASLDAENIALQKLEGPTGSATPRNKQDAIDALNQSYESAYNNISNAFIDLPAIMTDLQNVLYSTSSGNSMQNIDFYTNNANIYSPQAQQFKDSVTKSYQTALDSYNKNFTDYKTTSRFSGNSTIDSLLSETYDTTKNISQAIKDTNNLIQFYKDTLAGYNIKTSPLADTNLATLNADEGKANSDITNLLSAQTAIKTNTDAVTNSGLDLQSEQLNLTQKQNALADAKANLANYYIYAPFSGTIGKVSVQELAQVGSGASVATLITTQKIAAIPLNEVDVSKVVSGQQAVITFDALPDLSVAGKVVSIDPIGTVTQGVVTYNVQIGFDTQDARVKSGMSMSANIITAVKQDALLVPNAAVKTQGATKYVQVLVNGAPQNKPVTIGLANDTNTEILTGVSEGDKVITQTVSAATSTTAKTSTSTVRIPGLGGGFGGGAPGR